MSREGQNRAKTTVEPIGNNGYYAVIGYGITLAFSDILSSGKNIFKLELVRTFKTHYNDDMRGESDSGHALCKVLEVLKNKK